MARPKPKRPRAPRPGEQRKMRRWTDEDLARITYRDPAFLARFLSSKGKIRSRRQTGLPRVWQARMAREVKHARELALLPFVVDAPEKPRRGRREERD